MASTAATISAAGAFTVCVFCGANPGASPQYQQAAYDLAALFHKNSWNLVYGGGTVGLMGAVSRTLVSLSGPTSVHGIIPRPLIKFEQGGVIAPASEYGTTTVVEDMHARKAMMGRLSKAFVVMPGGFGTMEEFFEVVTWNQLGIHDCPVVVLNIGGFYDGLLGWVTKAIEEGFIKENLRGIIVEAKTVDEVEEAIRNYTPAEGRFDLDWKSEGKV
ncbi:hypothetical protein BZA05DRAFT_392342 [Tricharina praecox]|uniref:uncharacterized protein n=1 Tax=Tricharina praecox TaxID=43433 RepID=UPI0022210D4D|nr:uncharacterized protein BZA05DRAFT_392342 [Tricharina praecox]KAI5854722.1 hypothetical protein BZA05DRAFT_392342 [Tricharina praecox]